MPEVVQKKVLTYLNNSHESIKLLYVSKYFRNYFLNKNYEFFYLSTGFCSFKYWEEILSKNGFNLLHKIYEKIETSFDHEECYIKLLKTLCHLSLFLVCLHFLTCHRSCSKISTYCIDCSHVRAHNFTNHKHFFDIVV